MNNLLIFIGGFIILSTLTCLNNNYVKQNNKIINSKDTTITFENYEINKIPQDWTVAITGKGNMCKWDIVNNNNKVLAQTSNKQPNNHFNLITNNNLNYTDLEISVKFKAVNGKTDQGGGPIWRYIDNNNYYVVRANPLENNFRVYKVVNGYRIELSSSNVDMVSNRWYTIKAVMKKNKIQCYFNGELKMELTDDTFINAGKIGLWTKSDAETYFDDLKIISTN